MSDPRGPENEIKEESQAQQAKDAVDVEYDRYLDILIGQIEREEFLAARETVEKLLQLKPSEAVLWDATAFLETAKPPADTGAGEETPKEGE